MFEVVPTRGGVASSSSRSGHLCSSTPRSFRTVRRRPLRPHASAALETAPSPATGKLLGEQVRGDFPILHQTIHDGKPLIYLDSAATSQKPQVVIDTIVQYYGANGYNSNVHRGVHYLASLATTRYEQAREKIAAFINAKDWREVVYTKNASEAINLVAFSWARNNLKPGDEIITSAAEHHSNLEVWQRVARWTGAVLRHVPIDPKTEELDMQAFRDMLGPRTKLVALVHVSNMLGSVLPVADVAEETHRVGAKLLLDCCQSVPNMPTDVQTLGADWIVGSAHKMCGPTGIGFLWGRFELLASMPPFLGGGEMIEDVSLQSSTYAEPPFRFEAGTPPICEAIAFGAACDYLTGIGMQRVHAYERELGGQLYEQLAAVDGLHIYGPPSARGRAALCSFNVAGIHPNDISQLLDDAGIAIRSGSHCTQPLHAQFGTAGSARASLYLYNTPHEIDVFIRELKDCINFFRSVM